MDAFTEDWNESQFWVSSTFPSFLKSGFFSPEGPNKKQLKNETKKQPEPLLH